MANWTTEVEKVKDPDVKTVLRVGPVTLMITDDVDQRWQYFSMQFGEFSTDGVVDCADLWPREAIEQARAALNELEATL